MTYEAGEFAKQLIDDPEYQRSLEQRILDGTVSRQLAKTLLAFAQNPSPELRWLAEKPILEKLQRRAAGPKRKK